MSLMEAETLLAGSGLVHEVELPAHLLPDDQDHQTRQVSLVALTVATLQKIDKAAAGDENLAGALMIHHGLDSPALSVEQVSRLPAGLAQFLLHRINEISGISVSEDDLQEQVQTPLARACFILAREFGWTPEEVSGMTIGQILLYLEMVREGSR